MWEFFWFFLGAFVYTLLSKLFHISYKGKFIGEIKFLAIHLIGQAFIELVSIRSFRNEILQNNLSDSEEQLKLFHNEDKLFLQEWQTRAIEKLNNAVPPAYRPFVEIKDWEQLTTLLVEYHNRATKEPKGKFHDR
jgi:hypothetical protein